jgi:NAD(P)H-nitrite reductase large subunit
MKNTIICRCEDVTLDQILEAIRSGLSTMEELKRILRCGMGQCQGKSCGLLIAQLLARETGKNVGDVLQPSTRPPFKPIPLKAIRRGEK